MVMEREIEYKVKKTSRIKVNQLTDSIDNYYLISYIAMDGSYTFNEKKQFIRMSLSSSEKYILDYINQKFFPDVKIIDRSNRDINITNNIGKTYNYKNRSHWEMHFPIAFTEQLKRFGIVCHKPNRVIAAIPKKFWSVIALGLIDSDGSIVVRHRKDGRTPRLNIHIVSSAEKILVHLQRELENTLNISSSLYKRYETCVELRINNTTSAIKFCKWIYSNLPSIYNYKKKRIFDDYMSCVSSGELLEGRKDNQQPSICKDEGSETTCLQEVAFQKCEKAPDTLKKVKI